MLFVSFLFQSLYNKLGVQILPFSTDPCHSLCNHRHCHHLHLLNTKKKKKNDKQTLQLVLIKFIANFFLYEICLIHVLLEQSQFSLYQSVVDMHGLTPGTSVLTRGHQDSKK